MAGSELFDRPGGEPVELHDAHPEWPAAAAVWTARIVSSTAPTPIDVQHIGSTSVPGLIAKPVIDLQVSVPDIADEGSYRPGLEALGLVLRGREDEHRFFRPPAGTPRTVHVHVCQAGSTWERDHLTFRDRLRADPSLAAAYAALKLRLAATVGHDRLAYTTGKAEFIADAIRGDGLDGSPLSTSVLD